MQHSEKNNTYIGCQFSLYPMTDSYMEVILAAIADLKNDPALTVTSDDLSTLLFGPSENVFAALKSCFLQAAKQTEHLVLNVTFSHGCPGEPEERCCISKHPVPITGEKRVYQKEKPTGLAVSSQFALYPLNSPAYMDIIYAEIEQIKKLVSVTPKHYCTRLDGDASDVFLAIRQSLENAICSVNHVVVTAVISKH